MPAIDALLKRLGFVRLSQYGLTLTPENRILSMRPTVLTDGLGSRIVGWEDGDLAAMELERWTPEGLAPQPPRNRPAPLPPPPARTTRPVAVPNTESTMELVAADTTPFALAPMPEVIAAPLSMTVPAPMLAPAAAANAVGPRVEREPVVEEDDWEWTIALARARAEETSAPARLARMDPIAEDAWPKTEPLSEAHGDDEASGSVADIASVVRRARMGRVVLPAKATPTEPNPVVAAPRTPRSTVIPVPSLPTVGGSASPHLVPVVRTVPATARQLAKGTNPLQPKFVPEETVEAGPAYPADTDETRPAIMLPAPAAALPSIKRLSRR